MKPTSPTGSALLLIDRWVDRRLLVENLGREQLSVAGVATDVCLDFRLR